MLHELPASEWHVTGVLSAPPADTAVLTPPYRHPRTTYFAASFEAWCQVIGVLFSSACSRNFTLEYWSMIQHTCKEERVGSRLLIETWLSKSWTHKPRSGIYNFAIPNFSLYVNEQESMNRMHYKPRGSIFCGRGGRSVRFIPSKRQECVTVKEDYTEK